MLLLYKCENVAHDRNECPDFGKYTGRCMSFFWCEWKRTWDKKTDYERTGDVMDRPHCQDMATRACKIPKINCRWMDDTTKQCHDNVLYAACDGEGTPEPTTAGKFELIGQEIGRKTDEKNRAYGDSFAKCGEFLKLLYPESIKPEQYKDALALVRIFDKQMRIATDKNALGENPYRDIGGYGILGAGKEG